MRGDGFSFSAPRRWSVARTDKGVVARRSTALVSATRFTLLKAYDPATFDRVVVELDRTASKLAAEAGGTVTQKATTTVGSRKIRDYRYSAGGYTTRIGFVLDGKREVQLLCRARLGTEDPDGACGLLFRTFSLL